jgi:hypothetical protein
MLTQSRKPTATELLKAMHSSWLLSPSANKTGNEDNGGDGSEPTDVTLDTPGTFANAFNKKCFKCGVKGHRASECPKENTLTAVRASQAKAEVLSRAIAISVESQDIWRVIVF